MTLALCDKPTETGLARARHGCASSNSRRVAQTTPSSRSMADASIVAAAAGTFVAPATASAPPPAAPHALKSP
jgi:hypothetical protein